MDGLRGDVDNTRNRGLRALSLRIGRRFLDWIWAIKDCCRWCWHVWFGGCGSVASAASTLTATIQKKYQQGTDKDEEYGGNRTSKDTWTYAAVAASTGAW